MKSSPSFVEIVQDFMKKKKIYYFGFGSVDMKVFDDYINLVIKEKKLNDKQLSLILKFITFI